MAKVEGLPKWSPVLVPMHYPRGLISRPGVITKVVSRLWGHRAGGRCSAHQYTISARVSLPLTSKSVFAQTKRFPLYKYISRMYKGGGGFTLGFFRTRKFRTKFISHSGLKIPREISHPSRIVLFTSGSCTAKFQRVPGLFCEFPRASRWAFFIFRGFLHDLDLNCMPQTHLPSGCCAATNMWTPKPLSISQKNFHPLGFM